MDSGGIGGVAISDQGNNLIRLRRADSLIHGDNSRLSVSVIGHMVCGDFEVFGRDKEKYVIMFAFDFDVGFIAGAYGIDRPLILEIEFVAVESGCSGIIQDCLIRDLDIEDRMQDVGSLSSTDSKRDIEGKNETEDIWGIIDFVNVDDRFFGFRM